MTAARLQEAALARFAQQGYDATSMAEIAADVGIKKPSIYAHFRNKDALYLSLVPIVVETELAYARDVLKGGKTTKRQIHQYLAGIQERFDASPRVQFWIRALWMPPAHLLDDVMPPLHDFMTELETILKTALRGSPCVPNASRLSVDVLAMQCMAMIDSLQSELLYGGPAKYQRRLKSIWAVFDAALAPADAKA